MILIYVSHSLLVNHRREHLNNKLIILNLVCTIGIKTYHKKTTQKQASRDRLSLSLKLQVRDGSADEQEIRNYTSSSTQILFNLGKENFIHWSRAIMSLQTEYLEIQL